MTAYRQVYGFGHLRADCRGPGSASEPYARFEYGTNILQHESRGGCNPSKKMGPPELQGSTKKGKGNPPKYTQIDYM